MSVITSELVRTLREKTGAGMMDCKKALNETNGDLEAAVDWLRKNGLAAAAKKSGRVAAEGLVGISCKSTAGAVVEINAETDFVGRNEQFQNFVRQVTDIALDVKGNFENLKQANFPGTGRIVSDELTNLVATIGENMNLRRSAYLSVSEGLVVPYLHNAVADKLGRIAVLVALESKADQSTLEALAKQLAMHIAAAQPSALTVAEVNPVELEREREIFREQASASGKPADVIEKMIDGRIRKFYEEIVLEEQAFVIDGKTRIKDVVAQAAKEAGQPIKLTGFVRFALGEGIEKEQTDFAAEVAAQLKA